jgi:hypothetical protein
MGDCHCYFTCLEMRNAAAIVSVVYKCAEPRYELFLKLKEKRLAMLKYRVWIFCLIASVFMLSANSFAGLSTGIDESAKLSFWQWRSEGMSIRWVQRHPDQTRAFFAARQFAANDVEHIVNHCVFQTIYKNTAKADTDTVIEYDMVDWRVRAKSRAESMDDTLAGLVLKKHWLDEWKGRQVASAAVIAFEWALLPTRHRLLAGDYNWGMTTFGLKPGEYFDLHIVWHVNGKRHSAVIPDMQCATDTQPQAVAPAVK